MRIPAIGQGTVGRSEYINPEQLVNYYPETDATGRATVSLHNCPGLIRKKTLGPGPSRMGIVQDSVLYTVSGDRFYSLTTGLAQTLRGSLNSGSGYVSMATNGLVVVVVDGTQGWAYTIASGAWTQITDADFPVTTVVILVLDNTFIAIEGGTQRIWTSSDGTTWTASAFASAETYPDDLIGGIVDHQELILFGVDSTEIWYNSGGTFTFARRSVIENGCASAASVAKADNGVLWLDNKGIVRVLRGYTDERISTHSEEARIQTHTVAEIAAASAFISHDEGHTFYQLTVGDETFCYDLGNKRWHQRRFWVTTTGAFTRHRAQWCVRFAGMNIVGDYENGRLYHYDLDTYTDDGSYIPAIATYRPLTNEGKMGFLHRVEIEVEPGIGIQTGQGSNPQIELQISYDGGKTWEPWDARDIGAIGNYDTTCVWDGLGGSRNIVIQHRITDPVKRNIASVYFEGTPGRS